MTLDERLRCNVPAVTSENFDDEVVIVNFDNGKYHSVQGAGVAIWRMLEPGTCLAEILTYARLHFEGHADEIERTVTEFVARLRSEQLIVSEHQPSVAIRTVESDPPSQSQKTSFQPPVLTTFTDMQELLWLDPIHEVDEDGWPVPEGGGDS